MKRAARALVGGLLLVAAAHPAVAQLARISLTGVVRSSRDSTPLAGVTIALPSLRLSTISDSSGRFQFADVPDAALHIVLQRVGAAPVDSIVEIFSSMTFWMTPLPTTLDPTTVVAAADNRPASAILSEFETRRAKGGGKFLGPRELRKEDERAFTDVLRGSISGIAFESAEDGIHAYNASQQPPGALNKSSSNAGGKCYVQIVVDGVSIYRQDAGSGAPIRPPNLAEFMTRALDGVEYYSQPSRTPAEFRSTGGSCGTLVLWSRRG